VQIVCSAITIAIVIVIVIGMSRCGFDRRTGYSLVR